MALKELQRMMAQAQLTPAHIKQMKLIRKRMKNRISARIHSQKQHVTLQQSDSKNKQLHESQSRLTLDYLRMMTALSDMSKEKEQFCAQIRLLQLQNEQLLLKVQEMKQTHAESDGRLEQCRCGGIVPGLANAGPPSAAAGGGADRGGGGEPGEGDGRGGRLHSHPNNGGSMMLL